MTNTHGGQLEDLSEQYGIAEERIIDFSVSINPLGFPNSLAKTLWKDLDSMSRYPDTECRHLRRKLSHQLAIPENHILVGNGCNELIHLIFQWSPGATALIVQPTFSEYRRGAKLTGGRALDYILKWQDDFQIDLELLVHKASKYRFLFLCNPNNPTGQVFDKDQLLEVVSSVPQTIVVVDEAFIDFTDTGSVCSMAPYVSSYDNLMVLRSMTKFFAIPGLRLGYMIAQPMLIEELKNRKDPWSVNALAQVAGEYLIGLTDYMAKTRHVISEERTFLAGALSQIEWLHVYPSAVNFLLLRIKSDAVTAAEVNDKLMKRGIAVRDCSNFVGLNEKFFRVGLKCRADNQRLIAALQEIGERL